MLVLTTTSGDIDFIDGNLTTNPLDIAVTLTTANKIVPVTPSTDDSLSVSITLSTGIFTGSFKDPTSHIVRKFSGAMLQGAYEYGVGYSMEQRKPERSEYFCRRSRSFVPAYSPASQREAPWRRFAHCTSCCR